MSNPIKVIVLLSASVHLLIALLYQHITMYPDSIGYIELAQRLLNFDLNGYNGERTPGYPLLLGLTNISYSATVIIQSALSIASLTITYKTLLITNIKPKVALITTLILAIYLPIIFFDFAILSENLTLFVISLIFYFYFKINTKQNSILRHFISLSLLCAYLVLIKPFYIFLPILLFLFLVLKNKQLELKLSRIIILPFLSLFVFLGWSYVNKINTGYFVPTTFYGFNLAQNCVSFAEKTTPEYKEIGELYAYYRDHRISDKEIAMTIWEAEPELTEKTNLSFPQLSQRLYEYGIATIKKNPSGYLKQVFVSWKDFWKTSFYWEKDRCINPLAADIIHYTTNGERIIFQLIKILFVLLIPYNLYLSIRRKKLTAQTTISLIVLSASILQALATYGTNSRFSYPFELLICTAVILNITMFYSNRKKAN